MRPLPILLTALLLAIPFAAAASTSELPAGAQQIRDAASALDANADCEARLAQNTTMIERGGTTFSCSTACVSLNGGPATCSTRAALGRTVFATPIAQPRGPLGFRLWLPASSRGGGFDAAPFLSAFDPFGPFAR
ncbi:MAG: hypothetical protein QOE90_2150 [Thermoplasmata archaeon]|jgi:hypothetical protein|nr:hypothetical protein [Thermoplasmata archaeon]